MGKFRQIRENTLVQNYNKLRKSYNFASEHFVCTSKTEKNHTEFHKIE